MASSFDALALREQNRPITSIDRIMILKERTERTLKNKFEQAGAAAEEQMAFYLRRYFEDRRDVWVLNDVRISINGDFAQIDHLVVHTRGMVLIESKSVSGNIRVTSEGQWIREYGGKRQGMQSPITQVELQAMILCKNLNEYHRPIYWIGPSRPQEIEPKIKIENMATIVAISDGGIYIQDQEEKFPNLMKADAVCKYINKLISAPAPKGYEESVLVASARERANYLLMAIDVCELARNFEPIPESGPLWIVFQKMCEGDTAPLEWADRVMRLYKMEGMRVFVNKSDYVPVIEDVCLLASYATQEELVNEKSKMNYQQLFEQRKRAFLAALEMRKSSKKS